MLNLNEIKLGKILKVSDQPYIVIRADHHKMGRGGAVLKTKLRNLLSGNIIEKTFQGNDKAETAEVEKRKVNFMYRDDSSAYFMDNESYEQFNLPIDQLAGQEKFMKDGIDVLVMYYNNQPMTVELPIKLDLKVVSAPPGVKGNSAGNVMKQIELETGAIINAPMFIEEGDMIRVNTESGEYVERA